MYMLFTSHYITSLSLLSMNERIIYTVGLAVSILCCYLLMKPVVSYLMRVKSIELLSYLASSFIVLILFLVLVLKQGQILPETYQLFKFALQGLAVFGLILVLYQLFRYAKNKLNT